MENLYIVFQCPACKKSMKIRSPEVLSCEEDNDIPIGNAIISITNERGKTQLQKNDVTIYRLMPDLSFANAIVRQNSDLRNTNPRKEITGTAQSNRITLVGTNKEEQIEIFRGSNFSEEDFQKKPKVSN